jgi:hypothetical protein
MIFLKLTSSAAPLSFLRFQHSLLILCWSRGVWWTLVEKSLLDSCPDLRDCLVGGLDDQVEDMVNATKSHIQFLGELGNCSKHCCCNVCETKPENGTKTMIKNLL